MDKAEYETAIESAKFAIINEPISVFERLMIARALLAANKVVEAARAYMNTPAVPLTADHNRQELAAALTLSEALRELDQAKPKVAP